MARIPYHSPSDKSASFNDYYARLGAIGAFHLFRMAAHSEQVMPGFFDMGSALMYRGKLDPVLREIAINRVGRLCRSAYEAFQHERMARRAGLGEAMIAALRAGSDAPFDELQRLVLRFTDEVVKNVKAAPATVDAVDRALGHEQTVELTLLVGYYMMVCRFLETLEIDGESGQAEWEKMNTW